MKKVFGLFAFVIPAVFISCDALTLLDSGDSEKKITEISISGVSEIEEGDSTLLNAEILPSDADNKTVTWTSGDETVATVDPDGRVTARGAGNVTITAEATDGSGVSDDFSLTVTEAGTTPEPVLVSSIAIGGDSSLEEGETTLLSADVLPSDADNKTVTWTSGDETVATVDSDGRVTARNQGNVTITAEAVDGSGVSDDFSLTVTEAVNPNPTEAIIADHSIMRLIYDAQVPASALEDAGAKLRIGYGHTSHGSQITDGMSGLLDFVDGNNDPGERFAPGGNAYEDGLFRRSSDWSENSNGIQLIEGSGYDPGYLELDCGYTGWDRETREFLDDFYDEEVDQEDEYHYVIMWSWCGQVSSRDLDSHYFGAMESLEDEYPLVTFVYMTGHLDSDHPEAVLEANNRIRDYCEENGKVLFDFADIEKYNLDFDAGLDPENDPNYFGDDNADDSCDYDGGNWAVEWQNAHTEGVDWYSCGSAHSQPVNANQKAYAIWWLWARLAGWEG